MAAGINYSKWDSLEVSDSEDEEEATSKAALVQQHCEIEQTAAAQRKLRELIDEHNSGKPLEPPEEVRDILEEPLWCDEPRDAAAPANAARERAHAQRAGGDTTPARSRQDGGTAVQALAGAPGSMQQARTGRKRRDFADWDKLKLDDSESDEKRVVAAARPRAASRPRRWISASGICATLRPTHHNPPSRHWPAVGCSSRAARPSLRRWQ
jgi:hypothetical protein